MHFLEPKLLYFDENFIEICFPVSNLQYTSIVSDNGLVPVRRHAIDWSKDGLIQRRIYASLGLNELIPVSKTVTLNVSFIAVFIQTHIILDMYEIQ